MKTIGITGSLGKTSVCEILYQYLLYKNKKVALYSTNGVFKNGETVFKNFFATSYNKVTMENELARLEDKNYDYAIIEVKGELFLNSEDYVHMDIMALTNFYRGLVNNYNGSPSLLRLCKQRALNCSDVRIISANNTEEFPNYTDIWSLYDYSSLNPVTLTVDNETVVTDLFGKDHVSNLSLAIYILKKINEYDGIWVFNNLNIRGRYAKYTVGGKDVIVDTGWSGFKHIMIRLKEVYGDNFKFNLIYVPIVENRETWTTKQYKSRSKDALSLASRIIANTNLEKEMIIETYLDEEYPPEKVETYTDMNVCFQRAYETLEEGAILYIMAREKFREYKRIVEELS